MINKRGELTTAQLVTIIILIVSFIIILFLIFRLNAGEQSNKEICLNSVILKGKSSGFVGELDCRTTYLCVSGGENCANPSSAIEEVNLDEKKEIFKAIADEMADCWYMFGEDRKIRYPDEIFSGKTYCAICSIIEFDKDIQEKYPEITYKEFYDYLRTTKKEGSETYLNYLYGVNSLETLKIQEQFPMIQIDTDSIQTSRKYSVITGIDFSAADGIKEDEWLNVYIIPTSETAATACNEYVTKA